MAKESQGNPKIYWITWGRHNSEPAVKSSHQQELMYYHTYKLCYPGERTAREELTPESILVHWDTLYVSFQVKGKRPNNSGKDGNCVTRQKGEQRPATEHRANATGLAQSILTRQDSYYPIAQMRKDKGS